MVTESEIKEYYNRHHRERGEGSWRPPEAFPYFLDVLSIRDGERVLDVGCGTGYLLQAAKARGAKVAGVDISEEAIRLAQAAVPEAEIHLGKAESLPFGDGAFDAVYCLGAMEHFLDMDLGLQEMIRVARSGARLCILVPNVNYLYWKFSKRKGTEQQDINERLLSQAQWREVFERNGLEIADVLQDRDWFLRSARVFATANPLQWARALLRQVRWRLLPLAYTYQFIFVLRKP